MKNDKTFNFEILHHYGAFGMSPKGLSKELNLVSWCNGKPVYDLRAWNSSHTYSSSGITITAEELEALASIILKLMHI